MPRLRLLILVQALVAAGCHAPPQPASPRLTGTIVVANMNDDTASLIDAASRTTVATLPVGHGPHEVAVAHDGRSAVISNYGVRGEAGHTLSVIDVARAAPARTLDLGEYVRPHGMAFLPGDSILAVTSEARQVVVLVRLADGSVVDTLGTRQPASHMMAVTADGGHAYTTNVVAGTVTAIDVAGRTPAHLYEVAPMVEGIAVTPGGGTVWVGSNERKTVSVVDARSGAVVDSLTGFGFPYRLAVTPDGGTVLITDPMRGEVRIVDAAARAERARVAIPAESVVDTSEFEGSPAPEGVALSPDGNTAFVTLQGRNQVAILDLATATVTGYADTGAWPDGVGFSSLEAHP